MKSLCFIILVTILLFPRVMFQLFTGPTGRQEYKKVSEVMEVHKMNGTFDTFYELSLRLFKIHAVFCFYDTVPFLLPASD